MNEKPTPDELRQRFDLVNTLLNDTLLGLRDQVIVALDELDTNHFSSALDNQLVKRVLRCVTKADMMIHIDLTVLLNLIALVQQQLLSSAVGSAHQKVLFTTFNCIDMLYNPSPSHPSNPLHPRMRKLFLGCLMDRLKSSDKNNVSIIRETLRTMFFLVSEPLDVPETTCMSQSLNVQCILRIFDVSNDTDTIRLASNIISRCIRGNYISEDDFPSGFPQTFSKRQRSVLLKLFDDLHTKDCQVKQVMNVFEQEWKKCHTMNGFHFNLELSSQECSLGSFNIYAQTIQCFVNDKQDDGVITISHGCKGTTSKIVDIEFGNVKHSNWDDDKKELTLSLFEQLHDFHFDKSSGSQVVIRFIKNQNERDIIKILDAMELKRKQIITKNGPVFSELSDPFGFNANIRISQDEKIVDRIIEDDDLIVGYYHLENSTKHVNTIMMPELTSFKDGTPTNTKRCVSDVVSDEIVSNKKSKLEMKSQSDAEIRDFTLERSSNKHDETVQQNGVHVDSFDELSDIPEDAVASEDRTVDPSEMFDEHLDGDDLDFNLTAPETSIQKFKRIVDDYVPVLKNNLFAIQSGKTDPQALKETIAGIAKCDKAYNEARHHSNFHPDDFRMLRPEDMCHITFEVKLTDTGLENVKNRPVVRINPKTSSYVGGNAAQKLLALYKNCMVVYIMSINGVPLYWGVTQDVHENLMIRHWPQILDPSKSSQKVHEILHELGMNGSTIEYMIVAVCHVPKGVDSVVHSRRLAFFIESTLCYIYKTITSLETGGCNVHPGGSNGTLRLTLAELNIIRLPVMQKQGFKGNNLNFLVEEVKR